MPSLVGGQAAAPAAAQGIAGEDEHVTGLTVAGGDGIEDEQRLAALDGGQQGQAESAAVEHVGAGQAEAGDFLGGGHAGAFVGEEPVAEPEYRHRRIAVDLRWFLLVRDAHCGRRRVSSGAFSTRLRGRFFQPLNMLEISPERSSLSTIQAE